ncbi:MAG: GspE/PulE family protein [bacterium]
MATPSAPAALKIEDALIKGGMISAEKLAQAKADAEKAKEPLIGFMIKNKIVTDEQLVKANSIITKVPYVNLTSAKVDSKLLTLLPRDLAERYMAVPLGETNNRLGIAMLDADNVQAVDFLSNRIGRPLKVYVASEAGIKHVMKQYETSLNSDITSAFGTDQGRSSEEAQPVAAAKKGGKNEIATIVADSPISKALTAILEYAARNRASDIHIEPLEKELKIRCRIDGVLREIMRLPKSIEPALISRIKIMSNLKIDEHRTPQDGNFTVLVDGNSIDLRIAIAPIVWGEQVVIRLLDKSGTSLKLEDMGYAGRALRLIRKGLERPNGMILTSGPTGSGKATSMYALIQEIKADGVNIVTLEDPVEYKMEGINQIQVNAEVGLTFATGLRRILRQDPDVIMVGEIRDKETAQLAVEAALTGHLVFATLHTNSAAGILPRLLEMGIEPFLIASTVHTVIGQRLVRKIDDSGKLKYQSTAPETAGVQATLGKILPRKPEDVAAVSQDLGYKSLPLSGQSAYTLYKGTSTPDTPGGYKGRVGLYEVFEITDLIQKLILKKATSAEIEIAAQSQGMINMRQDGYLKALDGRTSIEEINRVAAEDNA